jgi:hypothetical protein
MAFRRLLIALAISFAIPGATACEWLDESCPDGYWRRRAGEACVPLPDLDAGADAGPPAADAGPPDGGSADAAAPSDAGADGATPSDAATDGGESADASSADASSDGGDAG